MLNKTFYLILTLLLVACGSREVGAPAAVATPAAADIPAGARVLTLMTHDSFDISEELIATFEAAHNVTLVLLPAGDAGTALNQAILARGNPLADVFFGVDNAFMGRALNADIFEPYISPRLADIPDSFKLDSSYQLLPVDYGDVCLNYDRNWFSERGLEPPQSLAELTASAYSGLTVVQNPATSSPGLAFLLATIAAFGEAGDYTYVDYWAEMRANDVMVTDGWTEAYFGAFSAAGDGERPLVVSYASSPPAEVVFADPPIAEPPTAVITTPGSCFRQVEFAGILRGTQNRDLAEALIDFMLDVPFQEDIPLHMFVFPVNANAQLPEVFRQWAAIPAEPAFIAPDTIDRSRDAWIQTWTDVVLR
jgi:thiamine transport system substrate-binding protein